MLFCTKLNCFIAGFLFLTIPTLAQEKFEGYIVLLNGDTVKGTILYPKIDNEVDFSEIHDWVQFVDSGWNIKLYKPKELLGFTLLGGAERGKFESLDINGKTKFIKRLEEGYWKLYGEDFANSNDVGFPGSWFYTPSGMEKNGIPGSWHSVGAVRKRSPSIRYYLDIQTELIELKQENGRFVIKQLKKIFKDYPDVISKLEGDMLYFKFSKILQSFNNTVTNSSK